jgi:hypothetical protein
MDYAKEAYLLYLRHNGVIYRMYENFGRFSPSYTVSNEHLSEAMAVLKPKGKSVLTVAASGDQAFYYKIYGASYVDTFDISYCAQVIMNVKTAAIQNLNYSRYKAFLDSIKYNSNDIMYASEYPKISASVPDETKQFLSVMCGQKYRFGFGYNLNVPTAAQYKKLRARVSEPFNFIWSDVMSLSGHLTRKYDQIYLSNIFQYNYDEKTNIQLIQDLLPSLNDGGEIMFFVTPFFRSYEQDSLRAVAKALERFVQMRIEKTRNQQYVIVKKL